MIFLPALALSLLAASSVSAQPTRQLDAHEHGRGLLRIAADGNDVMMELEAPGADIVGFEHAAVADADLAAAEAAREALSDPLALFAPSGQAGCTTVSAEVTLVSGEPGRDDEAHGHGAEDHAHEDEARGDRGHAHEDEAHGHDEDHADAAAAHAEFRAAYRLTCADPAAFETLELSYFARFLNARELEVQVVSDRGARSFEVERAAPRLVLEGGL